MAKLQAALAPASAASSLKDLVPAGNGWPVIAYTRVPLRDC